jgi:hypothetical protein
MNTRPTLDEFEAQKETVFQATWDTADPLDLKLVAIRLLHTAPHNIQFAVEFLGEPTRALAQGTQLVRHPVMGDMDIFMTPIKKTNDGFIYEAIFNYMLDQEQVSNGSSETSKQ